MASDRDLAQVLMSKSRGDIAAARDLAANPDIPDALVGFHAQQAVEKLLKALLARHSVEYPFTHDLRRLAQLVERAGIAAPEELEASVELTPWAVEFRYEDPGDDVRFNRTEVVETVGGLLDWATDELSRE